MTLIKDINMVEACRQMLWNSLFYVCLKIAWTSAQVGEVGVINEVDCNMPKWGVSYMGSRNVTKTGKVCQPWAAETPHPINKEIKDENFPDGSKEEAQNFCRNPDPASKFGVWCYTMESAVEWEYCDTCPGDFEKYPGCTLPDRGANYRGKLEHSQSHMECDLWSSHDNSQYKFPEGNAEKAKSYCRNPDPKTYEAPWCFIKGMEGQTWEYCDICKPFQGELKQQLGSYNKGSVQIKPMSHLACIRWCITWLTCLAVTFPHNENDTKCWYHAALNGEKEENNDWDQYSVIRICSPRAQGKIGYFVDVPKMPSRNGAFFLEGTVDECDQACIAKPDCVVYDRDSRDKKCYTHFNINDQYWFKDEITARHAVRCNPALKPPVDISDIVEAEATVPSPDLSEVTDPAADQSGMSTGSFESTETPKKKGGLTIVVVVVIVVVLLAIGGGGFAYYKLVYKKGKKSSHGDERQKLTSASKTSTTRMSKRRTK